MNILSKKEIVYNTDMELEHGRNVIGSIEYTSGSRVIGAADIIVYNSDYPITEKSFNERWPAYMIPVDTAFEGVDASQLNQIGKKDKNIQEQQFLKENAIAIGVGAGVAIFIVGGLIAVIRKKVRRRR